MNKMDKQIFARMNAEQMQNYSDAEIQRVFGSCVAPTKLINRVKELRDIDTEYGFNPNYCK